MVGRGADGIDASRLVAPAAGAYPVDGQHARRQRGYLVVPMREGTATEGRATCSHVGGRATFCKPVNSPS